MPARSATASIRARSSPRAAFWPAPRSEGPPTLRVARNVNLRSSRRGSIGAAMDPQKRQALEQHFALAERHVTEGERILAQQRAIIAQRRREGLDVELATQLLGEMEHTQRLHVADRERLYNELRGSSR